MRRSAAKLPYLPVYVGEVLTDTIGWTGEQRALLLLLMAMAWAGPRPLPSDPDRLAEICHYDRQRFAVLWQTISSQFDSADGGLVHARLEELRLHAEDIRAKRKVASRKGVAARLRSRGIPRGKPNGQPVGESVGSPQARPNGEPIDPPGDQPFREGQGRSGRDLRGLPGGRA